MATISYGKFLFSGKKCYDDPFYDHYEENGDDVYNYNAVDDNVHHNIIDLQKFFF